MKGMTHGLENRSKKKLGYATLNHNKVTSKQLNMVGVANSKHPDVKDGQSHNFPTGKKSQNDKGDED